MTAEDSKLISVRMFAQNVLGSKKRLRVERVSEGLSTDIYRVTREDEPFYVRVLPEADATFGPEAYVHRALRDEGVRVPEVIHYRDNYEPLQRSVMITSSVPGCSIAEAGVDKSTRRILFDAGRDLARINSVPVSGFGWVKREPGPVHFLDAKHQTYRDFVHDSNDSLNEHLALLKHHALRGDDIAAIREIVEQFDSLLDAPSGALAHGDLDTTHIFQHGGTYSGIIDFGEIRGAVRWYDLAHFRVHDRERFPVSLVPWLLDGYRTVAELPEDIDRRLGLLSLINAVRALARDLKANARTDSFYQRFLTHRIKGDIYALR